MTSPKPIIRMKQSGDVPPNTSAWVTEPRNLAGDAVVRHVALFSVLALLSSVMWVYRGHGSRGQLLILAYLGSLVATQSSVTTVFRVCPDFHAPCLLTASQLLFQSVVSHFMVRVTKPKNLTVGGGGVRGGREPPSPSAAAVDDCGGGGGGGGGHSVVAAGLPTLVAGAGGLRGWLQAFGPLAFCMAVSVLAHNASIMYIGLGLSTILSALSPAVTTLFCAALGQRFPPMAWVGIAIVSLGGIVTVSGLHLEKADRSKAIGCAFAMLALVTRAAKAALQELFMSRSLAEVKQIFGLCFGRFEARDGGAAANAATVAGAAAGGQPSRPQETSEAAAAAAASAVPAAQARVSTTAPSPSQRRAPAAARAATAYDTAPAARGTAALAPSTAAGAAVAASGAAALPQRQVYDSLQVWALQTPLMFGLSVVTSILTEGLEPWRKLWDRNHASGGRQEVASFFLAVLVCCAVSCLLGLTTLACVKLLGATGSQIVGKLNVLITATVAMIFMHERVEHSELVGGILLVVGAYVFEREIHGLSAAAASGAAAEKAALQRRVTAYAACEGGGPASGGGEPGGGRK